MLCYIVNGLEFCAWEYQNAVSKFVPVKYRKLNLRHSLIRLRKTSKIQKWVLVSFFAFWRFSSNMKEGGYANPNKKWSIRKADNRYILHFYRRKGEISFLFLY